MKVRTLVETEGPEHVDEDSRYVPRPAGFEIEHPDAWRLCLARVEVGKDKGKVIAEPLDDEAKAAIAKFKRTPVAKPTLTRPAINAGG